MSTCPRGIKTVISIIVRGEQHPLSKRDGTRYKLGSAQRQENNTSSLNVLVLNFDHVFNTKKALSMLSVKMMQCKSDTMKCGVAECATIHVLVHVKPLDQVTHIKNEAERFHNLDAKYKERRQSVYSIEQAELGVRSDSSCHCSKGGNCGEETG